MEHKPKTSKNLAEILSSISRRTPQSVRMSCTCLVLAKMSLNSLTGITSNAAPLSCLFGIVCRCDKSLTFHYFFSFYIVRNFDSSHHDIYFLRTTRAHLAWVVTRSVRQTARNRLKIGARREGTVSDDILETRRLPRTDGGDPPSIFLARVAGATSWWNFQ